MNGMRTNQFDAPTSFMTSISRRRAKVANRIVFTMRKSDAASSRKKITMNAVRIQLVAESSFFTSFEAVFTSSTPGWVG